jgi:hypothetical protein
MFKVIYEVEGGGGTYEIMFAHESAAERFALRCEHTNPHCEAAVHLMDDVEVEHATADGWPINWTL